LVSGRFIAAQVVGQVHHQYFHSILTLFYFYVRLDEVIGMIKGILNIKNSSVLSKARQQMLRSLPYKIPV
jgi:hypothetical protein